MLTVYIICAVLGGGLMLLSAFGGLTGDTDFSTDVDASLDVDHEIDFDHDLSTTELASELPHLDVDLTSGFTAHDFWLAFLSMRFFTYFAGTFGILGLALTFMTGMTEPFIGLIGAGVSFGVGYGGSLLFRYLKAEGVTSGVTKGDYIGVLGKTTVAISGSQPGKVRIRIKDDTLDMMALSEKGTDIARGEEIVVVGLDGNHVRVAPKGDYLD